METGLIILWAAAFAITGFKAVADLRHGRSARTNLSLAVLTGIILLENLLSVAGIIGTNLSLAIIALGVCGAVFVNAPWGREDKS